MSLSNDAVNLARSVENSDLGRRLFETDALAALSSLPDFQELTSGIAARASNPEVLGLMMLRALATQRTELEPRLTDASLVATYPGVAMISARHTFQVVREMIAGATDEIIVAGFAITQAGGLRDLLVEASTRVRQISILCSDWKGDDGVEANQMLAAKWPAAGCRPRVFRYADPDGGSGMHIKCVVVDSREVLVGSANFTRAGMRQNFELGIHVRGALANSARLLFDEFIRTGRFQLLDAVPST